MNIQSALYVGSVMHRRLRPRMHKFRYRAFWFLVDLDELAALSSSLRLFSLNRFNLFSFRDKDHGDGTATPLRAQVERQLGEAAINLTGGPIRLLCMPRTLGYCFNPLSVYFCYRGDGALAALVYQVHNTFGERHSYVMLVGNGSGAFHQHCQKIFYVSPFMDMNMRYDFRVTGPGQRIGVGICTSASAMPVMNAVLTGARKDLTDRNLMNVFLAIPAVTLKVIAAIHWEALRLWLKGLRLRRRPVPPKRMSTIITANSGVSE
ncbi:MAG TPA: DUF1365 domain-containing protein [Lacipirellulaceae bacterium]|nr:DUF1365 domain-containing protein [Lacipirellulaceae bacterium]